MKLDHLIGAVIALVCSTWASFTFFRGSITGAPPLYSHGGLKRVLHFAEGVIFGSLAIATASKILGKWKLPSGEPPFEDRVAAVLLFQFSPARIQGIERLLCRVQFGLRAHQPRSIHRVGGIFQFRTFGSNQLLSFFHSLLDGGVLRSEE